MIIKYPRTYHLPWSPGITNDDKVQHDLSSLVNLQIMVLCKMDGENTTMTTDRVYVRSVDSSDHVSRHYIKAIHDKIAHTIPPNIRICGENLYAKHSIHYTNLRSYFQVFSIWKDNICLSFQDTILFCKELELELVPIIDQCTFNTDRLKTILPDQVENDPVEGYVIRPVAAFSAEQFSKYVLKYVRKNHVQTDDHWLHKQMIKNQLR